MIEPIRMLHMDVKATQGGTVMRRQSAIRSSIAAPAALLIFLGNTAWAGIFDDAPVLDVTGDGYVFADPEEGVLEPGLKAVTTTPNADFPNTSNPRGITNCLMANNPDIVCDSASGSGKRIKTRLTGRNAMDIQLSTQSSDGITEYYTYGKTSNLTGARMVGLNVVLGKGSGDDFVRMDASDPAVAALFDSDFNALFNLPDGLFGSGGQEGTVGFFGDERATMTVANAGAILRARGLYSPNYELYFGDAMLDDTMIPDAVFWDATGTVAASDEDLLIAWYNTSTGHWQYGNLGEETPADPDVLPLDEKLEALADSLGVSVAELGYSDGAAVPADVLALMDESDLFSEDVIEDLRNMNLNSIIDLGDVAGDEVTLRLVPIFAPIVAETQTPYQFGTAALLDAVANVPYLDIGNASTYQAAIAEMVALDQNEQNQLLETTGFSFLAGFTGLGFEFGQAVTSSIGWPVAEAGDDGSVLATEGMGGSSWQIGDESFGFASFGATQSSYDRTLNGIGYDVDNYFGLVGVETRFSDKASMGVIGGYSDGTADADASRGEIDGSGFFVAGFSRLAFGQGGAVQAMIGYQDLSFDTTRNVMGETAKGSTDGSQVFGALQGEYMFTQDAFRFGPTASVEVYDLSVDGFDETGAGAWNLAIDDQSARVTVWSAGMRGEYSLPSNPQSTLFSGAIAYNSATSDDDWVETGFIGLPLINNTPVDGMDMEWVSVDLGVSTRIDGLGKDGTLLRAGYSGAFGDNYRNNSLQLSLTMQF